MPFNLLIFNNIFIKNMLFLIKLGLNYFYNNIQKFNTIKELKMKRSTKILIIILFIISLWIYSYSYMNIMTFLAISISLALMIAGYSAYSILKAILKLKDHP